MIIKKHCRDIKNFIKENEKNFIILYENPRAYRKKTPGRLYSISLFNNNKFIKSINGFKSYKQRRRRAVNIYKTGKYSDITLRHIDIYYKSNTSVLMSDGPIFSIMEEL